MAAAEKRFNALRGSGYAVAAHYDRARDRIRVRLNTGDEVNFAPANAEELAGASPDNLAEIEITPGGLVLIWPRLEAGLYVPALKRGILGSRRWMAEAARHSVGATRANRARRQKRAAERVFEAATLSLDHIAARASDHRPQSRTGALFSIALAVAEAELLGFPDLERREDHAARLRRRLYGLRAYLEDGVRTPDGVSGFYMRADWDPLEALRG